MDEKILHIFFGNDNLPQLKHIETAEIWDSDELTLDLYRDMGHPDDWYVLITAPAAIFLEDLEHVVDLIEQSFMVGGVSWLANGRNSSLPLSSNDYKNLVYSPDAVHHFVLLKAATDSPSLISRW